jgi:hypothetical protein
MAQTALQKAIEQLQSKIAISKQDMEYYRKTILMGSVRSEHDIQTGLLQSIQILTDLLPYERETIEAAYGQGSKDMDKAHCLMTWEHSDKTDYFTKTYTN